MEAAERVMCGLFGYTGPNRDQRDRALTALNSLTHRGPDQVGEWSNDRVYLGHRRLSIIDLSDRGRQPMQSADGQVVLTVNGEIYNFQELRRELSRVHEFSSQSDSEVLLHGYREWGIDGLLRRIDGMYAFVIYDARRNVLWLARDRVGIKPMYYGKFRGTFAWGSELKALETFFESTNLAVDKSAIYDFFTYLYVPCPKTLYKDVFKLNPGHYLEVKLPDNLIREHCYWHLPMEEAHWTLEDAADRLRQVIGKAVGQQMYSDVPVGFFLSGGIDSSVVTVEAKQYATEIHTYCIDFEEDRRESVYAKQVADLIGAMHHTEILEKSAIDDMWIHLRQWYDEPFADTSAFPTYLVSRFARKNCKVVLTGDGGDEIFGGYRRYRTFVRHHHRQWLLPEFLLPWISHLRRYRRASLSGRIANYIEFRLLGDLDLYTRLMGGLLKPAKRRFARLFEIEDDYDDYWYFRKYYREDLPGLSRLQYLDFHTYLPDDILTKVDRVSMATSLEARVPLLATEVVEFAFSLPEAIRFHDGKLKGLLRYAYGQILPREILTREKMGFNVPNLSSGSAYMQPRRSRQEAIFDLLYASSIST